MDGSIADLDLHPNFKGVLENLLTGNSYIAGGFALALLQNQMFGERQFYGDIDVYLSDQLALEDKLVSIRTFNNRFIQRIQSTKFAETIHPVRDYTFITKSMMMPSSVQVIKCNVGQIDDVISNFDLANCKVALKNDEFHVYDFERWYDLERQNMIGVDHWDPSSPRRISKYIVAKGYRNVESNAIKKLFDVALSSKEIFKGNIFNIVRDQLSYSDLLLLSGLCSKKDYDLAWDELKKRSGDFGTKIENDNDVPF